MFGRAGHGGLSALVGTFAFPKFGIEPGLVGAFFLDFLWTDAAAKNKAPSRHKRCTPERRQGLMIHIRGLLTARNHFKRVRQFQRRKAVFLRRRPA
jgi:hypothetical protein